MLIIVTPYISITEKDVDVFFCEKKNCFGGIKKTKWKGKKGNVVKWKEEKNGKEGVKNQ